MKKFLSIMAVVLAAVLTLTCFVACDKKPDVSGDASGDAAKTYLIVADNSFAPFEFMDETTNGYTGVDMDIFAAIAADQGFAYKMDNCGWDAALGNLGSGSADGMIAGMTITEERRETYDFSDPYFEDGQILFAKADSKIASLEDIKGMKVAVKTGTMGAEYVDSIKEEYQLSVESFAGSDNVYQAVEAGNVDLGVEDFSVINYKIGGGLGFKTVGEKVNVKPYGFAVLKGNNADLIAMFNAGLANIKANGKYAEILAKYGM